jgi:SecD/SecF fusion protein
MLYITIRYQWDYAIGCLVALVHDVLITLAAFAILRMEVNTELVSVLLTIIGYSVNNSIIIFDRIREEMEDKNNARMTGADYDQVANDAIDGTIWMSLLGSFTTILPVIFLLIMGSNSILTFNFAMFVGLIAGTFSSIFISPTVWRFLRTHHKQKDKKKKKVKKAKQEKLDEYTIKGINA